MARRFVSHRWNLEEGRPPPEPGQTIRGASHAHSWRITEVIPIDSPIHPNAWRIRCERLGPWKHARGFDWHYPSAAERAAAQHQEHVDA